MLSDRPPIFIRAEIRQVLSKVNVCGIEQLSIVPDKVQSLLMDTRQISNQCLSADSAAS